MRNHTYNYLIGAPGEGHDAGPGTDFHAINNDSVSVSPIQIDMTNHTIIEDLRDWLI